MVFPFDYTARGLPLMDGTAAIPGYATSYNAMANALDTALDEADTAAKEDDWVEFLEDLPLVDNWPGRIVFVEEDENVYVWNGSTWRSMAGDTGWIELTLLNSWGVSGGLTPRYRKVNGMVWLTGRCSKVSPSGGSTHIATLPVGFRPTLFEVRAVVADGLLKDYTQIGVSTGGLITAYEDSDIPTLSGFPPFAAV